MSAGTNGGYGRGRPKFDDAQRREILAAYDGGESAASIAKRFGCSPAAVYYHLKTTLRHVPMRDRHVIAPVERNASCVRCGIALGRPGICLDCYEVEGSIAEKSPEAS